MSYPVIDMSLTGARIRDSIRSGGYRVDEVSTFLGMSASSLYRVFRGERMLSLDAIFALSEFLGMTVNDLIASSASA